MKILLIAPGSRGDVQPYVALGAGLLAAGHDARVLTTGDFEALVTGHGLTFVDTGANAEQGARQKMQGLAEEGNLLKIMAATGRGAQLLARQSAASALSAARDADLLLGGLGGLFLGQALAEKLDIPFMPAYLQPFLPTREFASVVLPSRGPRLPSWANHLSHRLTRQMMWQMFRAADRAARVDVLGLSPAPFWGPRTTRQQATQPTIYGYSPLVVPPPRDWPSNAHVTGYWFLDPPADWEPPADLARFLEAGPPPVYIGFGSMSSTRPEATADLVLRALARTGQRGILHGGWDGLRSVRLPEHVLMVGSVPHSWLFARVAAVVHHGGAGTTGAGLRAGVPSIVTPFFGDQPFWGRRVFELGVGPRPIRRRDLSVERLTEAIDRAVSDPAMRQRAANLGDQIRAEQGISRAVGLIEGSARSSPTPRAPSFHDHP